MDWHLDWSSADVFFRIPKYHLFTIFLTEHKITLPKKNATTERNILDTLISLFPKCKWNLSFESQQHTHDYLNGLMCCHQCQKHEHWRMIDALDLIRIVACCCWWSNHPTVPHDIMFTTDTMGFKNGYKKTVFINYLAVRGRLIRRMRMIQSFTHFLGLRFSEKSTNPQNADDSVIYAFFWIYMSSSKI